jgi:acetoacetyl-CoA synthetase
MESLTPIWTPSAERIATSRLTAFVDYIRTARAVRAPEYRQLHTWSVLQSPSFWTEVWNFTSVIGDRGLRASVDLDRMPGGRYFPDAMLNFTENVLRRRGEGPAILGSTESGRDVTLSHDELRDAVGRAANAFRASGIVAGDRIAAIAANTPETIVGALGAAAIGAVWSSCSPDFGVQGILDRFGQIGPRILLTIDGYRYGGKSFDCLQKAATVAASLPSVNRVVVQRVHDAGGPSIPDAVRWDDWLREASPEIAFERRPFDQPLYILYSSGTTGAPKCIVHGAGGTLLQHLKEHQLHCDIRSGDRVFYFTTCGWMMWNWLLTALASEATLVLYDGSPFHRDARCLFDLADRHAVTLFGVSAKYLDSVRKAGLRPRETHSLASIRTITSTGSPLAAETFEFVHDAIKTDVHLASISGGTDIVSCFVGGNPNAPVWAGEIQVPALGMDVDVFDAEGRSTSEAGDLVCKSPFPSMPVAFWNDPNGAKYRAAYFERFPNVWCHGDWIRRTEHDGFVIYGRSDATLNPGGVRIGTAEIYRQVEQLPEVIESLAVGQQWDGDERIVLFVRLAEGVVIDDILRRRISERIRRGTSPRHVPARIIPIADIPRTKSGKIVELAVRNVIHGRPVTNREALANPEALDLFRDLPALRQ